MNYFLCAGNVHDKNGISRFVSCYDLARLYGLDFFAENVFILHGSRKTYEDGDCVLLPDSTGNYELPKASEDL